MVVSLAAVGSRIEWPGPRCNPVLGITIISRRATRSQQTIRTNGTTVWTGSTITTNASTERIIQGTVVASGRRFLPVSIGSNRLCSFRPAGTAGFDPKRILPKAQSPPMHEEIEYAGPV
jgi:hypothetical protein